MTESGLQVERPSHVLCMQKESPKEIPKESLKG